MHLSQLPFSTLQAYYLYDCPKIDDELFSEKTEPEIDPETGFFGKAFPQVILPTELSLGSILSVPVTPCLKGWMRLDPPWGNYPVFPVF